MENFVELVPHARWKRRRLFRRAIVEDGLRWDLARIVRFESGYGFGFSLAEKVEWKNVPTMEVYAISLWKLDGQRSQLFEGRLDVPRKVTVGDTLVFLRGAVTISLKPQ